MSELPRISLMDTLNVIQLARETALARGADDQARRLAPVASEIQSLVARSQGSPVEPQVNAGVMGQEDFRQMLNVVQSKPVPQSMNYAQSVADRNQLIQSMAAANMTDLEIARQMEMTREEVNLVLSLGERAQNSKEVLP